MADSTATKIGVERPLEKALERTITLCFREFDLGKWFVWGFSAFMMILGEGGGGSFNFNFPGGGGGSPSGGASGSTPGSATGTQSIGAIWPQIQNFLNSQIVWIMLGVMLAVFVIGIALWILVIWLQSRFDFIFLDNILKNHTRIADPWDVFSVEGNKLFKWRLLFWVCYFFALAISIALIAAVALGMCWDSIKTGALDGTGIAGIIIAAALFLFLFIPLIVFFGLVTFTIKHFIVPLMYDKAVGVGEAWRMLKPVMLAYKKEFLIYLLVRMGIAMAMGFISTAIVFGTCGLCCLGCIPLLGGYLVTTITLPLFVFSRLLAVDFTRQFDFDAPPPEPEAPAIPEYDPKAL